jgi:hypothetical protein
MAELYPVKRMMRGSGVPSTLTDSQTFNRYEELGETWLLSPLESTALSGPFLVSRTGDAG